MFHRLIKPLSSASFFLFGARGTGKTTLLKEFLGPQNALWIDLLDPGVEDRYGRAPESLAQEVRARPRPPPWVVLDEVQKVPRLLDVVHLLIEEDKRLRFALTGSSARKLTQGGANLLAGRAYVNHLFPLTHFEQGGAFSLEDALRWGALPRLSMLETHEEKREFLRAYALTYLKEEVWGEHLVRRLDPFRKFLEVAAAANGQIVNYSGMAGDIGADTKTVQAYFEVLEDTLLGVTIEPYHRSIRKRQRKNPKFYFFDTGVARALSRRLEETLVPGSEPFGRAFEHFLVLEAWRLNDYRRLDYRFSYLRTKDDAEIDLVIERPGLPLALVEIKSKAEVGERDVALLERFRRDFGKAEAFCLSRDPRRKKLAGVAALPWQEGLAELGLLS